MFSPAALLALGGLPAGARVDAEQSWYRGELANIPVDEKDVDIHGDVTIKIATVGGDVDVAETRFADGHYEVTVSGGGDIGAALKGDSDDGGSVTLGGHATTTYSFATQSEADNFVTGLASAATPKPSLGDLVALADGPTGLVAATGLNVASYLNSYRGNLTAVGGGLDGGVNLKTGGGEVNLSDGVGVQYNIAQKQTTAYIAVGGDVTGALGLHEGTAAAGSGSARGDVWREITTSRLSQSLGRCPLRRGWGFPAH